MRSSVEVPPRLVPMLGVVLLVVIAVADGWCIQRYRQALQRADHASLIADHLQHLLLAMVDAETGQRGYAIAGSEEFLAPYERGLAAVEQPLAELRDLLAADTAGPAQWAALETAVRRALAIMAQRVSQTRAGDAESALVEIAAGTGLDAMDDVRAQIAALRTPYEAAHRQHAAAARAAGGQALALVFGGALLALLLVAAAGAVVRRDLRLRRQAETERDRFFDLSLDMLCISNQDGYFKRLSPAFTVTLGWSMQELLTKPFLYFVHPDDQAATLAEVKRQTEAGEPVLHFENRYRHQDGSYRILAWRSIPQPGGYMYATARDVTAQRAIQEALRRSEESLTVTLQSIGDAVLATDVDGRVTRLNPVAEALTGWTAAEAVGRPVGEVFVIVNEETRQPAEIPVARVLATGQVQGLANHTVVVARDGTERAIADSAAPIRDRQGVVLGVVLVFRDVTPEREAARLLEENARLLARQNTTLTQRVEENQAALAESERLAHAALDALTAHVAILDERGVIIAANQGWRHCPLRHGLTACRGEPGDAYLAACEEAGNADAIAIAQGIRQVMAGSRAEFTHEYQASHGQERRAILCRVTRFPTAGALRLVVSHEDITQLKQRERLVLRTQRMESLGTLASGVAHDLNNALSPIIMGVQMLRARCPQEGRILDVFESSAKRGANMVKQLMAFAKGSDGERVAIPLGRLLKELGEMIHASFPKNIQLVLRAPEPEPSFTGDPTQVYQVLMNLCVNARDAMPAGGILTVEAHCQQVDEVYASTHPDAHPGSYVVLRVRDTGTGIPAEILDRIFDPFFSTKSPDQGTGLGLATVQSIVRGHGGFIQVYSQPGRGTTFAVHFPTTASGREATAAAVPGAGYRGQGEVILCVDDEPAVLLMTCEVLRRLHFEPIGAVDGVDALLKVSDHRARLRLVLTDLHMPHMDGLAFVRALRRVLPDLPVIVTSGQLQEGLAAEFRTLGVTSFLDKPCTEEQLVAELRRALPGA